MSDLDKIIYTSVATIIGGVFVLVMGQIVIKFLIEPYQEYRKLLAEIVEILTFHGNVTARLMKPEDVSEARKVFRQKASRLRAITYTIPFYTLFVIFRLVPSRKTVEKAAGNLIGISNMLSDDDTRAHIDRDKLGKEVSKYLHLRHYK